jgi:recombination associated protein RdgC
MFRNARFYRFDGDWPASEDELSENLAKVKFQPCGPLTERSSGWVAVNPATDESLARRLHGADLLQLRSQSRVLPPAAINEALEERLNEFRERMQEEPGRRVRRRLKAETRDELLPKSLLKSDRIRGYVDIKQKILAVDAAQDAAAERFLSFVRQAFEGMELRPLRFKQPVGDLMTGLFLGDLPPRFSLGRECVMQDATDAGSKVRWSDFDLTDSSIRSHVADGMRLVQLGIEYDNLLGCVLDENGTLRKLRLLGVDADALTGDSNQEHAELAKLDSEFVLLTGTLRNLLDDLKSMLDGYE